MCRLKLTDGPREITLALRDVALDLFEFLCVGSEKTQLEVVREEAGPELARLGQRVPMFDDGVKEGELDCAFWFVLG